jgi:LmeA-like phospholipid-binding
MDGTVMRKLLIVLVVLGLIAVIGDRVALKLATDEAQRRLDEAGLTSAKVDVGGFPFLTQALARQFDDVQVSASSAEIGTGRAELVSGTAQDVKVPSSGPATAGQLTAKGTIAYAEVLRQVNQPGLQLSNAGDGQVELKREVSVLGSTYSAVARGRVTPEGNRLLVTPTSVQLAGGGAIDATLSRLIKDRFTVSYRIRGLPDGLHIERITPTDAGFVVGVAGRDVALVR